MPFRLSIFEIKHRLQALRNYERMHKEQKKRIEKLEQENKVLRQENTELKAQNESILIQLAELQEKVFGKTYLP